MPKDYERNENDQKEKDKEQKDKNELMDNMKSAKEDEIIGLINEQKGTSKSEG